MESTPDVSTVDLTRTKIKLRADVIVTPQVYGNETYYHIELPSRSQFYRIGHVEYVFVSLLNGNTTFCEALAMTARTQGALAFPQQQALSLYSWLLEQGIAVFADGEVPSSSSAPKSRTLADVLPKMNPFWIRLPLGKPDAALKILQPMFGWLFAPATMLVAVLFMLAAGVELSANWEKFESASTTVFAPDNWLWLLVAWILLKTIHETAHGLTCQRYGGTVRETGVILAFFAPLAYVDVTSCWSFRSKWQRIHTAAAGMYVELLLASVAVFAWPHITSDVASHLLYNIIIMASVSTLLFNANPLMRFDGYYILSDLLQIPNLYSQASQATQQMCDRILFGVNGTTPVMAGRQIGLLRIYGVAAFFWRLLICGTMMIAASVLFHGAGVLLSIAGIVAWFGVPMWKTGQQWMRIAKDTPARSVRAAAIFSLTTGAFSSAFLLPVPFGTTAPGFISLHEGCRIRTDVSGFIQTVHVANGQEVHKGDLLVSLRNDDITARHADLLLQVEQETIRRQIAMRDHDAGLAAIAESNLISLRERLNETAQQADSLRIVAQTAGRVIMRHPESAQGTYLEEGKDVLVIDDGQPRELHVSVAQEDFALANRRVQTTVDVRLGTRQKMAGTLSRVIPRASKRLIAPALAATDGGDLPVTAASDDRDEDIQLTEARFKAIIELSTPDASVSLPIGERGRATLGRTERSVGAQVYHRATQWLENQIAVATRDSRL